MEQETLDTVSVDSFVRDALDTSPQLREMLFPFGFVIAAADAVIDTEAFPFYGLWREEIIGDFRFIVHPQQRLHRVEVGDVIHFMLGHAYDPTEIMHEEARILEALSEAYTQDDEAYTARLNQLTGVFVVGTVEGESLSFVCDAMAMQTAFFGQREGAPFVVSHSALAGILCHLEQSDYVRRLVSYRFFHLFGRTLPSDLSPYDGFRRLLPNHRVVLRREKAEIVRIFPLEAVHAVESEESYGQVIEEATRILQASMSLIALKWDKPAISMTGGCDSQTTLACANGHYADYRYFSYLSSPMEAVDVEAAASISEALRLPHEVFDIQVEEIARRDAFEVISAILELNGGDLGPVKRQEVAKRIVLRESDVEVEIKSWASETARAYFHKRLSKSRLPSRPTARYLTTLYKLFVHDRNLVRDTDAVFQSYLDTYCSGDVLDRMDWWDLTYWECNGGAGNGFAITGIHRFAFAIDIPYNNRILLQALLKAPLADRIVDEPHRRIRDLANPALNALGVSVKNVKHTRFRALAERAYVEVHSRLPM